MKTETKHTKGEWEIQDLFSTPNEVCIFLGDGTKQTVIVKGDNCEANAKLIAAAPELLEALMEISNCKNRLDYHSDKKLLDFVIELSNSAIKKATE